MKINEHGVLDSGIQDRINLGWCAVLIDLKLTE
jgi:hypothetical protein